MQSYEKDKLTLQSQLQRIQHLVCQKQLKNERFQSHLRWEALNREIIQIQGTLKDKQAILTDRLHQGMLYITKMKVEVSDLQTEYKEISKTLQQEEELQSHQRAIRKHQQVLPLFNSECRK